jgi:DNA polymerase III delta subunit
VGVAPPGEQALLRWGQRRLAAAGAEAEPGALEALLATCERDALAFLNEVGKLAVLAGREGRVAHAHVQALTAPRLGADLPDFLLAVASGDAAAAAQRLERLLAAGESEGAVLWALGNLVAGSVGGWSRWKDLAFLLARRRRPHELARALDAVYRAESAWKAGRTDARSALEQATREVASA